MEDKEPGEYVSMAYLEFDREHFARSSRGYVGCGVGVPFSIQKKREKKKRERRQLLPESDSIVIDRVWRSERFLFRCGPLGPLD